ncbi:TetR/AcrR family transcriptional regulator [Aquimarina agarilytica]|uniref:TetR/AcrR family transcriptional regulator n=1 Tax=Aquimarina agarilytica TaxID=1087449 RepID=UPI00028A1C84|nr:TetR/AcrR family transcriptional regulator [Aquimarina agarilytica]
MNPHEIKQHIIEVSSELFYKNGYCGTSITEIIEKVSVEAPIFYDNFESKEAICVAFLEKKNEKFLRDIGEFLEGKSFGNHSVISVFDFLEILYDSHEFNGCWRIKTISDIPKNNLVLKSAIQKHKENFLLFLEELIATNKPDLTDKECKILSKQVYVLYEGAISESFLHNEKWPIATAKALCERIVK